MKLAFILSLLISSQALACLNTLPISEARKAIALEPGAGAKSCKDLPEEQCLCFDGVDWEQAELKEILTPVCSTNEQDETTCEDKPSGQFELKENQAKKKAKEDKKKADEDAAKKIKEAKEALQTTFKEMAEKSGSFTTTEIQRLLKALAQEKSEAGSDMSAEILKLKTATTPKP